MGGQVPWTSRRTWYSTRFRNSLILALDTNYDALGRLAKEQEEWLARELENAGSEAGINFVFAIMPSVL